MKKAAVVKRGTSRNGLWVRKKVVKKGKEGF